MTPPDSDELTEWERQGAALDDGRVEASRPTGKPDSDAREVCRFECRIGGVLRTCNRSRGHKPPHVLDLFKQDVAREPVGCGDSVIAALTRLDPDAELRALSAEPCVSIPLSLAQRILAALEEQVEFVRNSDGDRAPLLGVRVALLQALAAELRERMEQKP